jgi:hypothetical protein
MGRAVTDRAEGNAGAPEVGQAQVLETLRLDWGTPGISAAETTGGRRHAKTAPGTCLPGRLRTGWSSRCGSAAEGSAEP